MCFCVDEGAKGDSVITEPDAEPAPFSLQLTSFQDCFVLCKSGKLWAPIKAYFEARGSMDSLEEGELSYILEPRATGVQRESLSRPYCSGGRRQLVELTRQEEFGKRRQRRVQFSEFRAISGIKSP